MKKNRYVVFLLLPVIAILIIVVFMAKFYKKSGISTLDMVSSSSKSAGVVNSAASGSSANFTEIYATRSIIADLQKGGYVLYMRHGKTDTSRPDQFPTNLNDCNTQRPLSDEGRSEIRSIGLAIKQAKIPIDRVISSPLCRAKESAVIVYGDDISIDNNLMYTAHLTTEEKIPVVKKTRELLSTKVSRKNANILIVAHAPNLADLMGYFPKIEGTVVVFRPLGNNEFVYMATILPSQWEQLLK